jgi:hypothetical protein
MFGEMTPQDIVDIDLVYEPKYGEWSDDPDAAPDRSWLMVIARGPKGRPGGEAGYKDVALGKWFWLDGEVIGEPVNAWKRISRPHLRRNRLNDT